MQHKIVPLYSTDVGLIYRNMAAAYMDMGQNSNAIAAYQVLWAGEVILELADVPNFAAVSPRSSPELPQTRNDSA